MTYELFYLIGASREADLEKIKKETAEIITASGGIFEPKETLEKRHLAYKIKKEAYGFYVAQRFNLEESEKLEDINRKLNLNLNVLRFIINRADELPALKSRQERIEEEQKNAASAKRAEEKSKEELPTSQEITLESKEEGRGKDSQKTEDIDKKLEEILNI